MDRFAELAARERCLFAVIGEITGDGTLSLDDELLGGKPIDDLDLAVILEQAAQDVAPGDAQPARAAAPQFREALDS